MYYKNTYKTKLGISYRIKRAWENFWYKSHTAAYPIFGRNTPQSWKTFRYQRLFNVLMIIAILCVLIFL